MSCSFTLYTFYFDLKYTCPLYKYHKLLFILQGSDTVTSFVEYSLPFLLLQKQNRFLPNLGTHYSFAHASAMWKSMPMNSQEMKISFLTTSLYRARSVSFILEFRISPDILIPIEGLSISKYIYLSLIKDVGFCLLFFLLLVLFSFASFSFFILFYHIVLNLSDL